MGTKVIAEVKRSGYEFAFTYEPGANALPLDSPFLLKRLQIERYTTRSMFAASLELPGIFAR